MVKGTTRQVIVVKGAKTALFDQAIFLVRDDILSKGGVTEAALMKEAQKACKTTASTVVWQRLLWSVSGGALISLAWLLSALI